ncbi:MAG: hypothetical protein JWM99_1392 [Verrucomicrobiales bacterium]|nr:hypothetical protein [Verrucomicrobiales bacterium]
MSGLDVLTALKSHPYSKHCILVMLSGLKDVKAINAGYQLGAKTFLLKPLTKKDIVELLNSLSSQITIEELPNGYMLHWVQPIGNSPINPLKAKRISGIPPDCSPT